ncbi:MAG: hypothetical protein GX437_05960 [Sphingobacteriales bacterium]|nr:hypothetical protein [Sphingobacteriales bacterium]
MKKFLLVAALSLPFLFFNHCKKDLNELSGTWSFTIVYNPYGGQTWSESGTATLTMNGNKVTANVTMTTGEKYTRYFDVDGEKVVMKGTYTQPVASDPDKDEIVTYDGQGTFSGTSGTATGTYNQKIPDFQVDESGTFTLTAQKK